MSLSIRRRSPSADAAAWQWPEDLHPVLRQVYARRSLSAPQDLNLALSGIAPVGSFGVLESAVELLLQHRDGRIVIAGDYDSDGATSTALMLLCMRELGFTDVRYFIPDRFRLGYGLSVGAVEEIAALDADLIVTVDNGISSAAGIAAARAAGIDVLVTDHHVPPDQLPDANVIVNPNLPGTEFPGQHLAGVGVAFYVLAALGRALGQPTIVTRYLDLVALGTVADLVRLDRGNRILVQQGLARIRAGQCRPGIRALCEAANVRLDSVTAETLAYQVGPRLNAAGRLEEMSIGVECLLTESTSQAGDYAARLDQLNRSRRDIEATMRTQAMEIVDALAIDETDSRRILVLDHEDWHEGIVGLIASRVRERSGFPSFAFAPAANGLKGSGRSVPGFHLRDALAELDALHPGVIDHFGGHAMAAGLSLQPDRLQQFTDAIEEVAARRVDDEALRRVLHTDGELDARYLSLDSAAAIRAGGPWGQGFPEPMFDGEFSIRSWRWLKDVHLSLKLEASDGRAVEAIAFNSEFTEPDPGIRIRAAYRLSVNDYFGDSRLQLIVEHCESVA
jgi:single-stranded-DNA-specific exonuclease